MGSEKDDRSGGPGRIEPLTPVDPPAIGPYRLLGRLGAGGMGRVYLARSAGGRTVAVKVVHEEHTSDTQFRARFRREVEAARRVGEEFTAPVLEADPEADRPWVATGYVPGLSLEQAVREYGPLPTASVHALADGLLRALEDIHAARIVHRDLKPSNVMLTVEGPRVIDFGIARAVRTSVESLLTSTGMAVGSPGFMAPEQILAEETGPRADVFALGCVLTYAATGRLAFGHGASNQHALMYRIVEAEPDLTAVSDGPLRELIARCLTKGVDERPDVAALLADPARPRPGGGRGAWLPGELVARLAQQTARLLDVEVPTPASGVPQVEAEAEAPAKAEAEAPADAEAEAPAEETPVQPEAKPEAEAEPEAGLDAELDAEPQAEPDGKPEAAQEEAQEEAPATKSVPDNPTFPLRKEPTAAEAEAAAEADAEPGTADAKTPLEEPAAPPSRRPRKRAWIVVAAVLAVLATGSTVYFLKGPDRNDQGAPGTSDSAPPGDSGPSSSPTPSKSKDADDAKGKDKDDKKGDGKGEGEKGDTEGEGSGSGAGDGGGGAAGSDGGSEAGSGTGTDAKPPAGGGSSDSGGSGSGSGGNQAPSGGVPSYFAGTWKMNNAYGVPGRIEIKRVGPGQQAVSFFRTPANGGGGDCVSVARLISVEKGGTRLNLDDAKVDTSRSTGYGCIAEKPSYIDMDAPSGINWFSNKDHTSDNNAWRYYRS